MGNKFSGAFGVVIGLVFISAGLWMRRDEAREQATLVETQGTVVDTVKGRDHDNRTGKDSTTFSPVIEFQVDGKPVRFTGSKTSSQESNGNRCVVRYYPKSPAATARVVDALEGLTPWAMFVMGALSLASGLRELFRRASSASRT
jgi:hypothetical protein